MDGSGQQATGVAPAAANSGSAPGADPSVPAHADPSVPAHADPSTHPRAGRNLPMAIGVGVGLGAIIIACLILWRPGFMIIIGAAMAAAVWEMRSTLAGLPQTRQINLVWIPLGVGVVATAVLPWWWGHQAQAVGIAVTALVILLWRLTGGAEGFLADVSASVFLLVYIGLCAGFATLLLEPSDGRGRILTFLICVVCSDTGGYAAGVLFGKHPMAPKISPKKSWEGLAGSLILAMTGGALSLWLLLHHPWWQGVVIGAALAAVATCGDLVESLIKRDIGVKDMGNLLPGHGGVMDRLDSLLPCAVIAWLLLTAFAPMR